MTDLKWKTEKRKVKDLKLYPKNPRTITDDRMKKLIRSLDRMNLAEIPAINTDNTVIAGNQRIKALIEMKRQNEEIDVRVPNRKLKKSEFEDYLLTSNLPTGEWDEEQLKESFDAEFLEYVGFDMDFIEELFPEQTTEGNIGDDEVPEVDEKDVYIKTGDLYQLGNHRLLCGDATKREDVDRLMDGNKADMVFTDPPYNVQLDYKNYDDNRKTGDYLILIESAFKIIEIFAKLGASIYCMSGDKYLLEVRTHFKSIFRFSQLLLWIKENPTLGNSDYQYNYEALLYGWNGKKATHRFYGGNTEKAAIQFNRDLGSESVDHPAQRPVELVSYYIKNSSQKDQSALDLFGGSGSTLIACEKTNRSCYMMEIDPYYCQVIIERWEKFTEGKAVKL